jgi:chorismate synthase
MLEFRTAGESHGRALMTIIDGLPAGINIDLERINRKLYRRQGGYGRGGRMKIERDRVELISGIRQGKTIGSPVGILIYNRDWENWDKIMSPFPVDKIEGEHKIISDNRLKKVQGKVTKPRPGHADLAGAIKYNTDDIRNILERASARETAVRTAVGGLLDNFLDYFNIDIISHVIQIGKLNSVNPDIDFSELKSRVLNSPLHCYDRKKEKEMMDYIDSIKEKGDTLGGIIEIRTTSLPPGLGSHTQWNRKLDGQIAQALMSIPGIKGIEIGPAFENSAIEGSRVHDEIFYNEDKGFYHNTNRAGGLEGGISNGEPLIIRLAMKPIPTLYQPLMSVDIKSKKEFKASVERSDVTAVPAAGVVAEAMLSFIISKAILEKFGGDSIREIMDNYKQYLNRGI